MTAQDTFARYGVDRVLEIAFGSYRAVVSPQGAALKTLHMDGAEIVAVPLPVTNFSFAGSTIAPWPNRLEDASWTHAGIVRQGVVNEVKNNNALHGLTVRADFDVPSHSAETAVFRLLLEPSAVYPFTVELLVTYCINADGLTCTFEAKNLGADTAPLGYATHPYFAFDSNSQLRVTATKASLNSDRQLPIGEQPLAALGLIAGEFVSISELQLDDCIYEFAPGERVTSISRPTLSKTIEVWQDENCGYLMLFTRRPKTVGDYPELLAVEPQTCPANALRSGKDLVWLEPNASHNVSWGIRVTEAG